VVVALLLLLPRACTPGGGFELKRAVPGLAPPDGSASMPPFDRGTEGGPGLGGPGGGDGRLPGQADPLLPGASQPDAGLAPPPDAQKDTKPDATPPQPPRPDAAASEPKLDTQQDPKADLPKIDPKVPDDPAKKPDRKGQTDPPKPPPKDMKMPDDPNAQKKMGFLEGDWKAGEGLVDKRTREPLDLGFKFGKDGQGEVTVRRPDGSTCSGTVLGRMSGGKLGIEGRQEIPCSNGGSYAAPKIECAKERDGQTQCYGVNPDGSRYYMGMQRQ
jgi:hypothetical protein